MLTHSFQRSKEKNLAWEDTRRRNEASMARKRANAKAINPAAANSSLSPTDGPLSPSSTGAMDSLLEKLRAAAPQARDQRDRRRRARLKDRHQVRVASGQTIPDMGDLTQNADGEDEDVARKLLDPSAAAVAGGEDNLDPISEGEDIADRAASLLEGLRKDGDGGEPGNGPTGRRASADSGSGSLRVRRRRESADVERASRRRRRGRDSTAGPASSTANDEGDDGVVSPPGTSDGNALKEEPIPEEEGGEDGDGEGEDTIMPDVEDGDTSNHDHGKDDGGGNEKSPPLPQTVISPPSPEPGATAEAKTAAAADE